MSETTLVDTNVLLDVLTDDAEWGEWSSAALAAAFDAGIVVIDPIVYAETSVRFERIEDLDALLPKTLFRREQLPYVAGFLAGKAFVEYRSRGGTKSAPLPDFFVGAHAAVAGHRLLTRDSARFRTYFPAVDVIAPS